jgi:hypothetical protein
MKIDIVKRSEANTHKSKYNDLYAKLEKLTEDESVKISFNNVVDSTKFYNSFANCLRNKDISKTYTMCRNGIDVYISRRKAAGI